jgi:hypothetical protein
MTPLLYAAITNNIPMVEVRQSPFVIGNCPHNAQF